MNFIYKIHFIILISINGIWAMDAPFSHTLFDPSQRPDSLKGDIQHDFDRLSRNEQQWNYNGTSKMIFLRIDSAEFIKSIIQDAPFDQKDFYVLDIGAGNFSWGIGTAEYLNKQMDIPEGVTIHLVSVTGENYGPFKVEEAGRCKLYNIGAFKIEDLKESFEKVGLDLNGKLDLIVSRYTFLHLHDPVGTFVQAYNLLRPGTGFMLMEGLPIYFGPEEHYQFNKPMVIFLTLTQAPFIYGEGRLDRWTIDFLLRRPNALPLNLPLAYAGILASKPANSYRKTVPYFKSFRQEIDLNQLIYNLSKTLNLKFMFQENTSSYADFYGDKEVYEWVYNHYPFWRTFKTNLSPLFKNDPNLAIDHR